MTLEILQPGRWIKVQTASALVQSRCRIGHRLNFSELCASTTGLELHYASEARFLLESFSLKQQGLLRTGMSRHFS